MRQSLTGVPETLLIPLWARAAETKEPNPIIRDEKAVEIALQIDYDFSKFNGSWMSQTGVAVRTEILDRETEKFIRGHPEAVIVNIGCGLDTRYPRMDNGRILWCDLDLPEPIRIRKHFFQETRRYRMIGKSVFDYSWIEDVGKAGESESQEPQAPKAPQGPRAEDVLFLAEGVLMYFSEQQIIELMDTLIKQFPGAHMLFEMFPRMLVKNSDKHETLKKTDARVQWGLRNGKDAEKLNPQIRFLEEWNFFDYHRDRWRWMRWLSLIPSFHNNFNDRIVHIAW